MLSGGLVESNNLTFKKEGSERYGEVLMCPIVLWNSGSSSDRWDLRSLIDFTSGHQKKTKYRHTKMVRESVTD
jgi:hypothetical protein